MGTQRYWLGIVGLLAWAVVSVTARAGAQPDENTIHGIAVTDAGVEITLHSSRGFPVRDAREILHVGQHEFVRSHYGADGDLHTLSFVLTAGEFTETAPEDAVVLHYGHGRSGDEREFGLLGTAAAPAPR
jgi:hypothetical protein